MSASDVAAPAAAGNSQLEIPVQRGEPVLEIRGLCVDYGIGDEATHAVVDANLVLRRGEVLGLAGESGSGKSTLAYAATRLLREPGVITGGEVLFHSRPGAPSLPDGGRGANGGRGADKHADKYADKQARPVAESADLLELDEPELQRVRWSEISVVMQSALNALNPVISIGRQIEDVLRAHRPGMGRRMREKRAIELLEMVGITGDRLRSYPHELSGGMRQRAMIAMALALEPQVVIMDEPTTALDVVTQREILEELIRLRDDLGFAALFITHDLSLLIELADEIAVMYAGRLVERAKSAALFRAPRHPYTYGLLNSFPPMHGARTPMIGITGSPPDLRAVPSGCAFHPRCPHVLERCSVDVPQLVPLSPVIPPPRRAPNPGQAPNSDLLNGGLLNGAGGREVACWLHDPATSVKAPEELSRPDPVTAAVPDPGATEGGQTS
ncbi:MAG: ABC transporter ATP-binding protein [Streptosporangiaceae bacterium]